MASVPTVSLSAGDATVEIPQLGFGVYQVSPEEVVPAVTAALEAGYRHLDTAKLYANEEGVGQAIRESGVPRENVFVTSKLWNDAHGTNDVKAAFDASLERLGVDVIDLYLIHWPVPARDLYVETWRTLIELRETGRVRAVGVSNFDAEHLQRLEDETGELPPINQVELHPYFQQAELRAFHEEHGIATEAWSPLGQGGPLLADETVTGISRAHGVTPAQVVIRWHLQLGNIVIPKSVTPSRITENLDVFGFELSDEDMQAMAGLERGGRIGPEPTKLGS